MTCILSVIDRRGNVHMIADSLYLDGGSNLAWVSESPKVLEFESFLLGFAGEVGPSQSIQHWFEFHSKQFKEEDLLDGNFFKSLKKWMDERFSTFKDHTYEFLIASKRLRTVFCLASDGSVLESQKFMAIGSGAEVAIGAWKALERCPTTPTMTVKARMEVVMEIVAEAVYSVRGPFVYGKI